MPELSMTTFVDFVIATGTPKTTVARRAKAQAEDKYDRTKDFWKVLRDEIQRVHQQGQPLAKLKDVVLKTGSPQKQAKYPSLVDQYIRWVGRRTVDWQGPQFARWEAGNLTVRVNPELGMVIDGQPHLVKLYLKAEKPSKARLDAMVELLRLNFQKPGESTIFGILDLPRGHLFAGPLRDDNTRVLLLGEAASLERMWGLL